MMRRTRYSSRSARRGFSFVELLFAVLILGIGLIMVAAIFPVGLTQTKANLDETRAAAGGRTAISQLDATLPASSLADDNVVHALQTVNSNDATATLAQSNMVDTSDPRNAWVMMYLRPTAAMYAQICAILVNRSDPYNPSSTGPDFSINTSVRRLEPRPVTVDIVGNSITITAPTGPDAAGGNQYNASAAAPGSFVVIASDNEANNTDLASADRPAAANRLNGYVYRLGNDNGGGNFDAAPGNAFSPVTFTYVSGGVTKTVSIPSVRQAKAYIVGRNRTGPGNEFDGPAQDVAYYTTFISLK